jgi:hypothetical protein
MRPLLIVLAAGLLASPGVVAIAQQKPPARTTAKPPAGPQAIGKFDDWQAAIHTEAGVKVCYAFARATSSVPVLPGRGEVVLTVTQRPSGRDTVAISLGYQLPSGAEVSVQADQAGLSFYPAGRSAFARDGHAAVAAMQKARQAVARSPGPRNTAQVADSFSLRGFSAAYAAINRECPAK